MSTELFGLKIKIIIEILHDLRKAMERPNILIHNENIVLDKDLNAIGYKNISISIFYNYFFLLIHVQIFL